MTIQVISHPTHRQKQRDGGVDCKFLFLSFLLLFCRVFAIFECKVLKSLKCALNQILFVHQQALEMFYFQSFKFLVCFWFLPFLIVISPSCHLVFSILFHSPGFFHPVPGNSIKEYLPRFFLF